MIQTNSNPKMSVEEVAQFRDRMRRNLSKDFSAEEKVSIQKRIERINIIGEKILKNNGGKNPILGY